MRRCILTLACAVALLAACSKEAPLSERIVSSEMQRNPEASYIDGLEGKLKWNYTTGLELKAFLDVYDKTPGQAGGDGFRHARPDRASILSYVDEWYDAIIGEDGSIGVNYKLGNYSTDHICPARTLFQLYDLTGKEKYRLAMDRIYVQVQGQPRTPEGGFWHKQIYPDQMWLDGLYMAQPFYAEYTSRYVADDQKPANYADIVRHFLIVAEHTHDPATGLYRHAWDSSHKMFWCNPETGQSDHAWGRALGWYAMALVEVLPLIPADTPGRDEMLRIFQGIAARLPEYADPETGMWYQVLDRPGAEGNYVEATASAMFVYALLRGCREGYLDCLPYAKQCYAKLLDTFVTEEDGLVNLNRCCEVAGLGGKEMRRGDYTYYINEKIRSNDPKGIGPLVWAALENERL